MSDKELIYICAFRYALGRKTYIVRMVTDFLRNTKLSVKAMDLIVKEITEAEESVNNKNMLYSLGDGMDKREWLTLRDYLKDKLC